LSLICEPTGRLRRAAIAIADGSLSSGQTTTITDGIEVRLSRIYALDPSQDRILVQRGPWRRSRATGWG